MESGIEETKKDCCGKPACGCQSGCRKSCCGAKVLAVLLLFLVGGILGYLVGSRCSSSSYAECKMSSMASHCQTEGAAK